jgi:ABC-type branched-subunit amino acid transport system ATPase component
MLDEPLASLSPKAVDTIAAKLELVRKTGTAMIIIEQKVKKVLEFASRAFVLVNGSCVLSGEAKDILSNENAKRKYLGFSS